MWILMELHEILMLHLPWSYVIHVLRIIALEQQQPQKNAIV